MSIFITSKAKKTVSFMEIVIKRHVYKQIYIVIMWSKEMLLLEHIR